MPIDVRMDPSSIALLGLQQADVQVQAAASQIAAAGTSPDGANLDVVSLSAEAVALMSARNLYDANLATLKTANEMQKHVLDLIA